MNLTIPASTRDHGPSSLANSETPLVPFARRAAHAASGIVICVGGFVLIGWLFDVTALKSLLPGLVAMNPTTAAAFLLAGLSLWWSQLDTRHHHRTRWSRGAASTAAAFVLIIGALTVAGYLIGQNLGVDQLLFRARLAGNRIAPNTGLNFLLAGAALMLLDVETRGGHRPGQFLALATAVVSLLVLTGYAYGAHAFYGVAAFIPMALNTALAFAVLSTGILAARADRGLTAVMMGENVGSTVARRLPPAVVLILFVLGTATLMGQRRGLYDSPFGFSLLVVLSIVILTALIWWNAWSFYSVDLARKAAEEAAQHSREEANRANAAKSEFLSRMSHELRTPLNAVLGFAQLMEMDVLTDEQRDSVKQILKGGRHLLDLINEVLDIARIEAGRLGLSMEPVSVQEIVQETRDLIAPLLSERDVRFDRGADPRPDWHVQADRQRLKQVLLNLLANAIKYNRKGGTVGLSYTQAPGPRLGIQVVDTGPGIAADKLARIFTPFDRLGAEQTAIEGTGLGLALSKRLVEAMGGTLSIHSVVGQGSTFSVEFPQVDAPTAQLERMEAGLSTRTESAAASPSRVVLYIEDNPPNLKLVERVLEARPQVRLIPALQGRLGLTLAREHRPDLILLDLHLPDISGEEVLLELQRDPRTYGIPVVVTSADATRGRMDRLRAAGVRDYLTKPLDVKRLLAILDDTLVDRAS